MIEDLFLNDYPQNQFDIFDSNLFAMSGFKFVKMLFLITKYGG